VQLLTGAGACLAILSLGVPAYPAHTQTPPESVLAASSSCMIPAGTIVDIATTDPLDSKKSAIGSMFGIRLAEPIVVGGVEVLPAGAAGQGQVVHSARARAMGKAGELIAAARYIETEGTRIPLRSFKLGSSGQSNVGTAMALSTLVATPLGFLVVGGEVTYPVGMRANARLASDVTLPHPCTAKTVVAPAQ
jgi:hypothetical protein